MNGLRPFLVLRHLPGVTRDQFSAAQEAVISATQRATASGMDIWYRCGFFAQGEGWTACVLDARSAEDVRKVNEWAGVPLSSVFEAVEPRLPRVPAQQVLIEGRDE